MKTTNPATIFAVTLALLFSPVANAGSIECSTTCMGATGSGMTCTVTAMCPSGSYVCAWNGESVLMAMSAGFVLGSVDGMAMVTHTAGQGPSPSVLLAFQADCSPSVACAAPGGQANNCLVEISDGLPVELMEFDVEADEPTEEQEPGTSN